MDLSEHNKNRLARKQAIAKYRNEQREKKESKSPRQAYYQGYDASTGKHKYKTSEGVYAAKSLTNGSIGIGQKIEALANQIDAVSRVTQERPVVPVNKKSRASLMILYSLVENGKTVFYVGGHQANPVRIPGFELPNTNGFAGNELLISDSPPINNLGNRKFTVDFFYFKDTLDTNNIVYSQYGNNGLVWEKETGDIVINALAVAWGHGFFSGRQSSSLGVNTPGNYFNYSSFITQNDQVIDAYEVIGENAPPSFVAFRQPFYFRPNIKIYDDYYSPWDVNASGARYLRRRPLKNGKDFFLVEKFFAEGTGSDSTFTYSYVLINDAGEERQIGPEYAAQGAIYPDIESNFNSPFNAPSVSGPININTTNIDVVKDKIFYCNRPTGLINDAIEAGETQKTFEIKEFGPGTTKQIKSFIPALKGLPYFIHSVSYHPN